MVVIKVIFLTRENLSWLEVDMPEMVWESHHMAAMMVYEGFFFHVHVVGF